MFALGNHVGDELMNIDIVGVDIGILFNGDFVFFSGRLRFDNKLGVSCVLVGVVGLDSL